MQEKGRAILDQVEAEGRVAVLMIGRPYHLDPGLNHAILEEFQILGYPVLSIRSIPKDEEYLGEYFAEDLSKEGIITTPLEIGDVWPENYSSTRPEGVGGQVRRPPPQRGGAGSVVLQVRARRAHLRHHRQHHQHRADAVFGAARHRRQQAGRLDQDPGEDLRPQPGAARGAAGGRDARKSRQLLHRIDRKRLELLGLKEGPAGRAVAEGSVRRTADRTADREGPRLRGGPRRQTEQERAAEAAEEMKKPASSAWE